MEILIVYAIALVIGIIITRLLGSWLLRINEIIKLQKETLIELRKINKDK